MAMILVTHDLGVVAGRTDDDRGDVRRPGRREGADRRRCSPRCGMPYTEALLRSIPKLDEPSHTRLAAIARPAARPRQPADRAAGSRRAARTCRTGAARRSRRSSTAAPRRATAFRCWFPVGTPEGARRRRRRGRRRPSPADRDRAATAEAGLMAGSGTAHLRTRRRRRCCGSRTSSSSSRPGAGARSTRSPTSASTSPRARPSASSASRAAASRRPGGRSCSSPAPTSGTVRVRRAPSSPTLPGRGAAPDPRPQLQMIFQDPISSLNPRRRVGDIVAERARDLGASATTTARATQGRRGARGRRPRPRASRATGGRTSSPAASASASPSPGPWSSTRSCIICDEPVSALDVSVQAQILNLLEDMKARYGLTLIFIAHDLAVVKNVSDRVAVMYLGKLCEVGAPDELYAQPAHPYTAALLAAIPVPDPECRPATTGACSAASSRRPSTRPSGCRFRTRCPAAQERCATEEPLIRDDRPRATSSPATSRSRRARSSSSAARDRRPPRRDLRRPRRGRADGSAVRRSRSVAGAGLDGDRYLLGHRQVLGPLAAPA